MNASGNVDFARTHLGEDRYLTHLLMEARREKHRIGFCAAARCKTEACGSFWELLKQRRRWYLGTLTNEIYMLTSPVIWRQFPALNVLISLSAVKNGPLLVLVFISETLLNGLDSLLPLVLFVLTVLPIWLFVASYGMAINRKKIIWCYPFIILVLPFMASWFQIYGMITFRQRTWGGPRAQSDEDKKAIKMEEVRVEEHAKGDKSGKKKSRSDRHSRNEKGKLAQKDKKSSRKSSADGEIIAKKKSTELQVPEKQQDSEIDVREKTTSKTEDAVASYDRRKSKGQRADGEANGRSQRSSRTTRSSDDEKRTTKRDTIDELRREEERDVASNTISSKRTQRWRDSVDGDHEEEPDRVLSESTASKLNRLEKEQPASLPDHSAEQPRN